MLNVSLFFMADSLVELLSSWSWARRFEDPFAYTGEGHPDARTAPPRTGYSSPATGWHRGGVSLPNAGDAVARLVRARSAPPVRAPSGAWKLRAGSWQTAPPGP